MDNEKQSKGVSDLFWSIIILFVHFSIATYAMEFFARLLMPTNPELYFGGFIMLLGVFIFWMVVNIMRKRMQHSYYTGLVVVFWVVAWTYAMTTV